MSDCGRKVKLLTSSPLSSLNCASYLVVNPKLAILLGRAAGNDFGDVNAVVLLVDGVTDATSDAYPEALVRFLQLHLNFRLPPREGAE